MATTKADAARAPRKVCCARCGTAFECGLGADCWCAAEPYRMPITASATLDDCLCPACLRRAAGGARPGTAA